MARSVRVRFVRKFSKKGQKHLGRICHSPFTFYIFLVTIIKDRSLKVFSNCLCHYLRICLFIGQVMSSNNLMIFLKCQSVLGRSVMLWNVWLFVVSGARRTLSHIELFRLCLDWTASLFSLKNPSVVGIVGTLGTAASSCLIIITLQSRPTHSLRIITLCA